MTSSGTYDFNLTRNEIITAALENIGAIGINQTPSATTIASASTALNAIVKALAGKGVRIWDVERITIPIVAGTQVLGSDGYGYECIVPHTTTNSKRPITGADWLPYWKYIGGTDYPAWSSGVSATSGNLYQLDDSVVSVDNARLAINTYYKFLTPISRSDYYKLNAKVLDGQPNQYFFQRNVPGTPATITIFPYPDSTTDYVIELDTYKVPQDVGVAGDTQNFTQEYQRLLIFSLSVDLAFKFPAIASTKLEQLKVERDRALSDAFSLDEESLSMFLKPSFK